MSGIDAIERETRRARRAYAVRIKQFVGNLTTIGYGLLAGGAIDPLVKSDTVTNQDAVAVAAGMFMLIVAILMVPKGEVDGRL